MPTKHRRYTIHWKDCTYASDPLLTKEEALREPLVVVESDGRFIGEREDCIILGTDYIKAYERYRHVTWIPKVNIVKKERWVLYCFKKQEK